MSLEKKIESLKCCGLRHRLIEQLLSRELRDRYGHEVSRNVFIRNEERILGEIDVLVETSDSYRVYEVKSSRRGFPHGEEQLQKIAQNQIYWTNDFDKNIYLNLVTYERNRGLIVKRV